MDKEVIVNNVCPLVTPFVGNCWVCGYEDVLVAHDVTVQKSLCICCVDDALKVDTTLQLHYGSKVYRHD